MKVQEQITKLVEDMKPKGNLEGWVTWMGRWQESFQQESFALFQRFLRKPPTTRNQPGTSTQQVPTAPHVPLVQQQVPQQFPNITSIYSVSTGQPVPPANQQQQGQQQQGQQQQPPFNLRTIDSSLLGNCWGAFLLMPRPGNEFDQTLGNLHASHKW